MIYITFERGGPKFSNITARALAYRTAVQQLQLRAKRLLCNTRFFAFVSPLKLSRRLLCSVRFVFVSTFSLPQGRTFVVGITILSKQAVCVHLFESRCTLKDNGPDSVVGIATGYGLEGPRIESRWGRDFPHLSRPVLGPTQPPVQWVPGLSEV